MATLYRCSFCEYSFRSDKERKEHEGICVKNEKSERERFETKKQLAKQKYDRRKR